MRQTLIKCLIFHRRSHMRSRQDKGLLKMRIFAFVKLSENEQISVFDKEKRKENIILSLSFANV